MRSSSMDSSIPCPVCVARSGTFGGMRVCVCVSPALTGWCVGTHECSAAEPTCPAAAPLVSSDVDRRKVQTTIPWWF